MTSGRSAAWPAMSLAEADARLTVPGSLFEVEEVEIRGLPTKVWKNLPKTIPDVLDHARAFGAREFLVFEDERIGYDADANFTSGTFMDYLLPTAAEIPEIEIHHVETPSDIEANYRGVGEGGMILAPAALTNAIEDALAHLGVRITEQHLPPHRILELAGVT